MDPNLEKRNNLLNFMTNIPLFYCLEDFGNMTMVHNFFNKTNNNSNKKLEPEKYIGIIFLIEGKEKQIVKEIIEAKKFFLFIKIYYNQCSINILINRNFKISNNEILNQIKQKNLKTPIKVHLKIDEFPLKNYCLEELEYNYDNNIDKTLILKSLSATRIMLQNNLNSKTEIQKFNNNTLLKINQDKMNMKNNNIDNINNMSYQNNGQNINNNNLINISKNFNNNNNNNNFMNNNFTYQMDFEDEVNQKYGLFPIV